MMMMLMLMVMVMMMMMTMMSDETTSWSKPIAIYGYNDAVDLFGGKVFEAETNCIPEHNMGQVRQSGLVLVN